MKRQKLLQLCEQMLHAFRYADAKEVSKLFREYTEIVGARFIDLSRAIGSNPTRLHVLLTGRYLIDEEEIIKLKMLAESGDVVGWPIIPTDITVTHIKVVASTKSPSGWMFALLARIEAVCGFPLSETACKSVLDDAAQAWVDCPAVPGYVPFSPGGADLAAEEQEGRERQARLRGK